MSRQIPGGAYPTGSMWNVGLSGSNWNFTFWADTPQNPGKIGWSANSNSGLLGTSPIPYNQWQQYNVTLVGDTATLYINGSYFAAVNVGSYIPVENLNNFKVEWGTWGKRDIDNIQVNSVPVPAPLLLLGSGLIGLVGYRWRKAPKK